MIPSCLTRTWNPSRGCLVPGVQWRAKRARGRGGIDCPRDLLATLLLATPAGNLPTAPRTTALGLVEHGMPQPIGFQNYRV